MNLYLLPTVLVACLIGCSVTVPGDVNGDGVVNEDTEGVEQVGPFTGVTNRSDADVEIAGDEDGDNLEPGDVTILCEGGFVADVDLSVDSDGYLIIEMAADIASVLGCQIRVITDSVVDVVDEGDGDIVCEDPLVDVRSVTVGGNGSVTLASVTADELNILVTGNGAVTIGALTVTQLNIDLRGAGDATLAGDAVNADFLSGGNGDLRAKELTVSDTLDAMLNGTGNGVITVLGTVNAEVHGDASLEVYGGAEPGQIEEVDGGEVIFY